MSSKPKVLELDSRGRISLGKLAQHDLYMAEVEDDGTIILTPAVVMPRPKRLAQGGIIERPKDPQDDIWVKTAHKILRPRRPECTTGEGADCQDTGCRVHYPLKAHWGEDEG